MSIKLKDRNGFIQVHIHSAGKRLRFATGVESKGCNLDTITFKEAKNYPKKDAVNITPHKRAEIIRQYHGQKVVRRIVEDLDKAMNIEKIWDKKQFAEIVNHARKGEETRVSDLILKWVNDNKNQRSHNHLRRHKPVIERLQTLGFDVAISEVNDGWFRDFCNKLMTEKSKRGVIMKNSSIMKFHSFIKKVMLDNGIALSFKLNISTATNKHEFFLTKDELIEFENIEVKTEVEQHVKDLFLFQCYTGKRYGDVMKLRFHNLMQDDGYYQWSFIQQKTKKPHVHELSKSAEAIVKKYWEFDMLPQIGLSMYNSYLKKLAKRNGFNRVVTKTNYSGSQAIHEPTPIHEAISSHLARHTSAVHWLNDGMDYALVAEEIGIDIKTVKVYAQFLEKTRFKKTRQYKR